MSIQKTLIVPTTGVTKLAPIKENKSEDKVPTHLNCKKCQTNFYFQLMCLLWYSTEIKKQEPISHTPILL